MLHPIILCELAKIRYNALLQAAERYRLIQRLRSTRPLKLPRFVHFFGSHKPEAGTAVTARAH